MSATGEIDSAEAFFRWGAGVVRERVAHVRALVARRRAGDAVAPGEHLHARYALDGQESSAEWPTFQLDGYGTYLWALREHEQRHGRELADLRPVVEVLLEYVAAFWRDPTTDWWEERVGIHAATLACAYAGLAAWGRDEASTVRDSPEGDPRHARLDASLIACATPFGMVDRIALAPTLELIERRLVSPGGGVHRHPDDVYYGGGEWLLLTALLGWHYTEVGRSSEARAKLEWVAAHGCRDGGLPEQSDDHLLAPEHYTRWVEKWDAPPCPLLWSHAWFLRLATVL